MVNLLRVASAAVLSSGGCFYGMDKEQRYVYGGYLAYRSLYSVELLQAALLHELLQRIALDPHGSTNVGDLDLQALTFESTEWRTCA